MNLELLAKFYEQSHKTVPHEPISGHDAGIEDRIFVPELFAELLIRECANYINERTRDWDAELRWIFNDGSGDMAVDVDDLLNRHFGVLG
jgi:hypothetical protein